MIATKCGIRWRDQKIMRPIYKKVHQLRFSVEGEGGGAKKEGDEVPKFVCFLEGVEEMRIRAMQNKFHFGLFLQPP